MKYKIEVRDTVMFIKQIEVEAHDEEEALETASELSDSWGPSDFDEVETIAYELELVEDEDEV